MKRSEKKTQVELENDFSRQARDDSWSLLAFSKIHREVPGNHLGFSPREALQKLKMALRARTLSDEAVANLFDPDHDLDLVALANNARSETELEDVWRMGRARMISRHGSQVARSV